MTDKNNSNPVTQQIREDISYNSQQAGKNLTWLKNEMHPLFFILNRAEVKALSMLIASLHDMDYHQRMILKDSPKCIIISQNDTPGSLYRTLALMPEQNTSYAELTTSKSKLPNSTHRLEVLRFDYKRKHDAKVAKQLPLTRIDQSVYQSILDELERYHPDFCLDNTKNLLQMLCCNNPEYVDVSSPARIARIINLYAQTEKNDGIYLDIHLMGKESETGESRLLLGMASPPAKEFLLQLLEVFNRLGVAVHRSYCLTLSNGVHPYFLSTFYVHPRDKTKLEKDSELYHCLKREIYNTQILSSLSSSHSVFIKSGLTTGPEASFIDAMIGFCYTNLSHNNPHRYSVEGVKQAFHNHPDITLQFIQIFHARFNPDQDYPDQVSREQAYTAILTNVKVAVQDFNSGRRVLDEFRREVFHCGLVFIQHTLKTNLYVAEKHALAFRLDPAYLDELDEAITADLPADRPFRITYFYGRNGSGFHIGFSDIARGGWRTIITQGRDDFITNASSLFKENYVLAHTQHLKNKDIYEGGSKMVTILLADPEGTKESIRQQLYKLQFSFINAFFDLFVVENGKAKDPRVIDYYGEDEPIELGPDENMHDEMVELIAKQAVKRGYSLGQGVISSKKVGINHKDYGVTSIGVIRFAEVTMKALGIDMHKDAFSVKFTGGPNGDVAGNGMKLLLERCPKVQIKLIVDGSGALYDPKGLDHKALSRVILQSDLEEYPPSALHSGGFIIYHNQTKKDGMRVLYKKVQMTDGETQEQWLSTDKFYKIYNSLLFTVKTDLFIPAGGRPETINNKNVARFFNKNGEASAKVIIEGANSFITPDARLELQQQDVVIMRDASANKCGVISSSYEIIANLILSDEEFLNNKDVYVQDVITILNQMVEREANLIIKRHQDANGSICYTEISNEISREINEHYAQIFEYFQTNPELSETSIYLNAILLHMPHIIGATEKFRGRIKELPEKVKYAILASKLASSIVYDADPNSIYGGMIEAQVSSLPKFS